MAITGSYQDHQVIDISLLEVFLVIGKRSLFLSLRSKQTYARCESSTKRNWQDPTHKMYRCQFINVLASATSLKFVLAK
ncbi:Hypothetical predicted protein [Paramuricea clavata]|uniref:Uncharacterized protein n=1 Tax=Paramuricea clavata TaxID=317549 RepID=A0A7D9DAB3_PARCT|nr:Hypothetical predicted protein [Paramuricea clavata]